MSLDSIFWGGAANPGSSPVEAEGHPCLCPQPKTRLAIVNKRIEISEQDVHPFLSPSLSQIVFSFSFSSQIQASDDAHSRLSSERTWRAFPPVDLKELLAAGSSLLHWGGWNSAQLAPDSCGGRCCMPVCERLLPSWEGDPSEGLPWSSPTQAEPLPFLLPASRALLSKEQPLDRPSFRWILLSSHLMRI